MKKVLYIGWIGFGNLGDELLYHLFQDLSKKYLNEKQFKIIPSLPGVDIKKVEDYDIVVLGGGSLLLPGYIAVLKSALDLEKDVFIWGSGLDWIGEDQLKLMLEGKTPSFQQNFKDSDVELMVKTMSRIPMVGIRGPLTQKVMEMIGADPSNIEIIGDPGLLLKPPSVTLKKERIVAINWGTTYNRLYGQNEQAVEDALVQIARKLIQSGYKIWLYVVWGSDRGASKRLFERINDPDHVTYDPTVYTEDQLMTKLSRCTFSINFKLHANMMSLTAKVPCIALGYRFKVFDLFQSLGLEEYVVSTGSELLLLDLYERVHLIEKNSIKIVQQYQKCRQLYSQPLIKPFKTHFK
ncbi:polysaccharide pyruvyl transferase family protein [Fictibacillus fluitans]|uniref:Polysaccharide pyruvyl transferase family protein n=1 Tax=Fictibacillus fluitans TaxID=3058422 RepID=A0ABT8HQJ3_9BACL|nr:polysaccharide pyruvyl transferase family protein [Fictibacillus sp. NE201]MDN4523033.1 polysaccharide pyruvyl transferase family protein [Fictibacillus sp. NE201]